MHLTILVLFFAVDVFICNGELSLTTGPLIAGRPATLFCNIPVFSAAGQWNRDNEEFYVTQCDNSGFCSVETESTKYRYSSNSSGISVTINNIDRSEQRIWTCDHSGYSPVSYALSYNDNVFVTSPTIEVRGMDQNVTLSEDVSVLTLSFTTACMNPKPGVKLYYTQEDQNVTISANLESVYITNDTCLPPEAGYTGGITITSDDACSITILPRLLIAPEGLPFEYSTTEWVSSHFIKFPKCQEMTINNTKDALEQSNGGKVEMAVGISIGVVVLLVAIAYAAVIILKRKQKEEHFLDIGTNTQSIVPSIASVEHIGKDYDVEFFHPSFPGKDVNLPSYQQSMNDGNSSSQERIQLKIENPEVTLSTEALDSSEVKNLDYSTNMSRNINCNTCDQPDSGDEIIFVLNM